MDRLTINGALRYDHATSRYNPTCFGRQRRRAVDAGTERRQNSWYLHAGRTV